MSAISLLESLGRFVVATLINSVWEDVLIAFVAWMLLRSLPNVNATTRYAVWCSALVTAVLLPPITTLPFVTTQASVAAVQALPVHAHMEHADRGARLPATVAAPAAGEQKAVVRERGVPASAAPVRFPQRVHVTLPAWTAAVVFVVWGLVALVFLARLIVSLAHLERLKSDALPLAVGYREDLKRWASAAKGERDVRLCVSDKTSVPIAVGLFDAMILLPKHLLGLLSESEIDQIALHELAHLRRGDDWTNGVQRVVQALLFFNPGIAYIARQLDLEREVACDDWVLAFSADVRPYANCLTKMAEVTTWPHRPVAAPGVFVTRKSVSIRVERLLRHGRDIRTRISPLAASGVAAAMLAFFFVLKTVAPTFAFTLSDAAQPAHRVVTASHTPRAKSEATSRGSRQVADVTHAQAATTKPSSAPAARTTLVPPKPARTAPAKPQAAAESFTVPGVHVHVPARTIHVPAVNVDVPPVHVAIPAIGYGDWGNRVHACAGCNMRGVAWTGADLSGRNLSGINLSGANLMGVDFTRANLSHADLSGGKFTGVDFTGADLRGAKVDGAEFTGCDFTHADVTGVDFSNAKLVGDDFSTSKGKTPQR